MLAMRDPVKLGRAGPRCSRAILRRHPAPAAAGCAGVHCRQRRRYGTTPYGARVGAAAKTHSGRAVGRVQRRRGGGALGEDVELERGRRGGGGGRRHAAHDERGVDHRAVFEQFDADFSGEIDRAEFTHPNDGLGDCIIASFQHS